MRPKACESCNRVNIGAHHKQVPVWRRAIGLVFVYLPILTWPFVILSAYSVYLHLYLIGAKNVKKYADFLPARETHRYELKSQITMDGSFKASLAQSKLYWIFNCTWYCPMSVGLFEWHAYLVQVVENWWCPFTHGRKNSYDNASLDQSFWHIYENDKVKLHPDDRNNPIFTETPENTD
jgi:hypothetical protein